MAKIRLTEDKLHQLIYECVCSVLNEGKPGIQSQKLYDIVQKYGKIRDTKCMDIHNLRDEDVITVMPMSDIRQIMSDRRYVVDHWRWADNYALDAWAKSNGIEKIPGDRMEYLELGNGDYAVVVINRNENQVPGREGEGWDAYNQKREKRKNDKVWDGKREYNPKYKRPWSYSRMWKNPYKKTNWTRDQIDDEMQSIRDHYALGDKRETQY